jgi:type I restriction enzyme S subunit
LHAGFGSYPVKEVIDKFTKIVAPMFEKQRKLQKQNLELSEARDRLLPKLMSGELVV